MIVVGSRGFGFARRLMLGSVSRGVVRRATCPVLVVKSRRRRVKRLILATDGSRNASRALGFMLTRLDPPTGARVTVIRVVEPVIPHTRALLPAPVRRAVLASAASLNAERTRQARREVTGAAALLKRAGWRARGIVREGSPPSPGSSRRRSRPGRMCSWSAPAARADFRVSCSGAWLKGCSIAHRFRYSS